MRAVFRRALNRNPRLLRSARGGSSCKDGSMNTANHTHHVFGPVHVGAECRYLAQPIKIGFYWNRHLPLPLW